MKRSRAIQIIKKELAKAFPAPIEEQILSIVENLGMLPPPIEGKCKVEVAENGGLIIPIWGWEPEFEKLEELENEQK